MQKIKATVMYKLDNGETETEVFHLVAHYPNEDVENVQFFWMSIETNSLWCRPYKSIMEAKEEMFKMFNTKDLKFTAIEED